MKLPNIDFGKSGRKNRPGLGLIVPGGFWVAKSTFELAWEMLTAHYLSWNLQDKQCSEDLCGKAAWKKHSKGNRCYSLGRAVKYFAINEFIPWYEINKGKEGKRKYRYLWPSATAGVDAFRPWRPTPKAIAKASNDSSAHK